MARDRVEVLGVSTASPEAVWAIARDFCGAWHPAIATIRAERDAAGHLVRAFTVHGEGTLYRERRTFFSDSERTLAYTHLQGIAGVDAYDGRVTVTAGEGGGSTILWTAQAEASDPVRLAAICEGTKYIFEMGIAALSEAAIRGGEAFAGQALPAPVALNSMTVGETPRLALTLSPPMDGPLCLFLHGIGGARWNWEAQVSVVGSTMRAAALDLRGYGDSQLGPEQSTVEDYCDDILSVMTALGAEKLVLVGLSYGSWIATSFAMRHPGRLAGLVLSGGCTGMSEAGVGEREAFRTSRQVPLDAGQTPADFAPAVVKVLAGPEASEAVKDQLFRSMAAIPSATYRDALTCFTNPPERFDFSRLTMPVLMMTGEFDRLASPKEIRGVAGRIHAEASAADVRYETIANAGHVCNVEQPSVYNRILLEFLEGLPR